MTSTGNEKEDINATLSASFTDVQRRNIVTELVTKDGVQTLAIEKEVPGGSTKRLMLLNKVDAQALKDALERYLKHVYSGELSGLNAGLSPADMVALFGEDEEA